MNNATIDITEEIIILALSRIMRDFDEYYAGKIPHYASMEVMYKDLRSQVKRQVRLPIEVDEWGFPTPESEKKIKHNTDYRAVLLHCGYDEWDAEDPDPNII
jgi:hypothetical protein